MQKTAQVYRRSTCPKKRQNCNRCILLCLDHPEDAIAEEAKETLENQEEHE